MHDVDVVVVGAGLAGLRAALDLATAGHSVLVLEARDRVGGRLLNTVIGGSPNEFGGAWVGVYHKTVRSLATELGISLFPSHRSGKHLYVDSDGVVHTYDADAGESLPLSSVSIAALETAVNDLEAIATEIDPDAPWTHPRAAEMDAVSFDSWLDKQLKDEAARDVLSALVCDCFMTKPASKFSLLSVLGTVVAGAGGVEKLFDTAQCLNARIEGGSQALAYALAERLPPNSMMLNAAVCEVQWSPDIDCGVALQTADGFRVRARYAIIATPPNLAAAIEWKPALPQWRIELHASCTQGSVIKVLIEYASPFWREAGLSGEGFAPHSTIKEVYDNSPPSGIPGVLCVFLTGTVATMARAMDTESRRNLVLSGVAAFFGKQAQTTALAIHECDWSLEAFTGGGYCGTFDVGGLTQCGRDRIRPVGPMHFCCTEWAGAGHMHMEGALLAGAGAAAAVHARLTLGEVGNNDSRNTS